MTSFDLVTSVTEAETEEVWQVFDAVFPDDFADIGAWRIVLLDSVVPVKVALLYYVQLQAAFSGKTSPQQAMQNVDKGLKTLNP